MQPFLALITPVGGSGGGGGDPPQVNWPTFPTNPIARPPWGWGARPPGPLGTWGGGGVGDYIDAGFPGPQPPYPPKPWGPINYPDQGLPGNQPGLWPSRPPYVDIGFPGPQPGGPTHIWGGPWYPPVIWPGPGPLPYPDQGLPGPQPPGGGAPPDSGQAPSWSWAYSPMYGWVVVPGAGGGKPAPIPQPPDTAPNPPQAVG